MTVTYTPLSILGEHGYAYTIYKDNRVIAEGWSRGKQSEAELEARRAMERAK